MNQARVRHLIQDGENLSVEFKACRNRLTKNVFETISAFLNSNKPHGNGLIDPASFSPFPKNPVMARFFKEIGRADELGSGVRKLFRYCRYYSGGRSPQLIEADIFKCIVPLTPQATMQAPPQAIPQVTPKATMQATMQAPMQATMQAERIEKIIKFCESPRSREEIQKHLKLKNRDYLRKYILLPLIQEGILHLTMPEKPSSPNQKYYATKEKI